MPESTEGIREPSEEYLSIKEGDMKVKSGWHTLLVVGALSMSSVGCLQTTISGQALPSPYYLDDDVQYFPAGPEQKLPNQIRALERYKAERLSSQQAPTDPGMN